MRLLYGKRSDLFDNVAELKANRADQAALEKCFGNCLTSTKSLMNLAVR